MAKVDYIGREILCTPDLYLRLGGNCIRRGLNTRVLLRYVQKARSLDVVASYSLPHRCRQGCCATAITCPYQSAINLTPKWMNRSVRGKNCTLVRDLVRLLKLHICPRCPLFHPISKQPSTVEEASPSMGLHVNPYLECRVMMATLTLMISDT